MTMKKDANGVLFLCGFGHKTAQKKQPIIQLLFCRMPCQIIELL